jgi:hypothetical protein
MVDGAGASSLTAFSGYRFVRRSLGCPFAPGGTSHGPPTGLSQNRASELV